MGEIEFEVAVGPSEVVEDVRRCKLSCREGLWVGPLCKDEHRNGDYRILFRGCDINFEPPHQIVTYREREIAIERKTAFPDGAVLEFRCDNSGSSVQYAQDGGGRLVCNDGAWSDSIPVCRNTSGRGAAFSEELGGNSQENIYQLRFPN